MGVERVRCINRRQGSDVDIAELGIDVDAIGGLHGGAAGDRDATEREEFLGLVDGGSAVWRRRQNEKSNGTRLSFETELQFFQCAPNGELL